MKIKYSIIAILLFTRLESQAQNTQTEDSVLIKSKESATYVGGYGNFFYQRSTAQLLNSFKAVKAIG